MSWDFLMEIDVGGEEPMLLSFEENATYNLSPMFYKAFGKEGIRGLNNKSGLECEPLIKKALVEMKTNQAEYELLNPKNGWGNYEGAIDLLVNLLRWSIIAPKAIMKVQ